MIAFSQPNRVKSFILLAICGVLAIAAVAVGIDDNPPGILMAFLAAIAFVLAFVHPWRSARRFTFLLLASVLGFVLFAALNISSDLIIQNPATSAALRNLIESPANETLTVTFAMLLPAAFLVGAIGAVAMLLRNRRRPA
jgi:glucan phosphoethanolaminetransferase (alkaline phosphatase superfamily)